MKNSSDKAILGILFTGVLIGALDIAIVGPAIPSIETALNVDPRVLGWIFSIYVLFNLVGVSFFARLSDIYGRRNIFLYQALRLIFILVSAFFLKSHAREKQNA